MVYGYSIKIKKNDVGIHSPFDQEKLYHIFDNDILYVNLNLSKIKKNIMVDIKYYNQIICYRQNQDFLKRVIKIHNSINDVDYDLESYCNNEINNISEYIIDISKHISSVEKIKLDI